MATAHNLKKRFVKKHFKGIHDRFFKDPEFRASQLEHDRDEEVCAKMDDLADEDFLERRLWCRHKVFSAQCLLPCRC